MAPCYHAFTVIQRFLVPVMMVVIACGCTTDTGPKTPEPVAAEPRISLPLAEATGPVLDAPAAYVKIHVREPGAYVVDGDSVTLEQLERIVKAQVARNGEARVLIRADGDVTFRFVVNVLSVCRFVGVKQANIDLGAVD